LTATAGPSGAAQALGELTMEADLGGTDTDGPPGVVRAGEPVHHAAAPI
jgi:hypothetical protein